MTATFQQLRVTAYAQDVDHNCRVTPQAYLRFMDRARLEGIESLCRELKADFWLERYVVNVYKITVRFGVPAYNGENLLVTSSLHKTSSHRAVYLQRIMNGRGQMAAEAFVELLFLDGGSKELVPVPEQLPASELPQVHSGRPLMPIPFSQTGHFVFSWPIRVYYEDTDAQGITYHVSYFNYCERAFVEYIRHLLQNGDPTAWMNSHPIKVMRQINRYMNAAHLAERLQVNVGMRLSDNRTLILDERVVNEQGIVCTDMISELQFVQGDTVTEIPNLLCETIHK